MGIIVDLIDEVISNIDDEKIIGGVGEKVKKLMNPFKLFEG